MPDAGTHEVTVNIGAVSEAAGETDLATTQVLAAAKHVFQEHQSVTGILLPKPTS